MENLFFIMIKKLEKKSGFAKATPDKQNDFIVTKETIIGEITRNYPFTIEVFMDYGIHCVGCSVSDY